MSHSEREPDIGDVFDQLEELAEAVDTETERKQVRETMELAAEASESGGTFGRVIWGFDAADVSEALLGSLLFGIPMAVEGGTAEVAAFLVEHPLSFIGTGVFAVVLTTGILYATDIQDVRVKNAILGVVPYRLLGVLGVSFLMAVVLLTAWGRVSWAEPVTALASVLVAFVPMAIGAALGDILPGS